MNTKLLSVSPRGDGKKTYPRISFLGDWLNGIGFVPGSLVQVIPVMGGVDFRLCDENIRSFRELFMGTREMGGGLVRVYLSEATGHKGAAFSVSGKYISSGGLSIGDLLIAEYGYGIIRARKLAPEKLGLKNLRVVTVSHVKSKYSGAPVPKILINGDWLSGIGFGIGEIATATAEEGSITLSLACEKTGYIALQKYVRAAGMKIVQVGKDPRSKEAPRPSIFISGSCLEKAGFGIGDTLACSYEKGLVKFQKLDSRKLGFC